MIVRPGGNNYEIPNRVWFGCMGLVTAVLIVGIVVVVNRILTYPMR